MLEKLARLARAMPDASGYFAGDDDTLITIGDLHALAKEMQA